MTYPVSLRALPRDRMAAETARRRAEPERAHDPAAHHRRAVAVPERAIPVGAGGSGFIAVFGVAMLNGIVMVSFLNGLRQQGVGIREAVVQGAVLRLRPVLMTASIAIFGLVPMLLSSGVGAETQRPLATVVVGGLFTSTALTLLLLPLMYEWVEQRRERKQAK